MKYLPGIQVLDDLVQHSPKKMLYIGEIPDLKMKIRNWLLQDRYLSPAVYARSHRASSVSSSMSNIG